MGFRLQQKLMTLNDFELRFIALSSDLCVFKAEARIGGFRYKVATYLSYLYIKFDYEIEGNLIEFQA